MDHFNFLAKLKEEIDCLNYKISKLESKKQLLIYMKQYVEPNSNNVEWLSNKIDELCADCTVTDVNVTDEATADLPVSDVTDVPVADATSTVPETNSLEWLSDKIDVLRVDHTTNSVEKNMLEAFISNDESESMKLWELMNERRKQLLDNQGV
jgi:hypothetical protein